jgi:dimethylargininase
MRGVPDEGEFIMLIAITREVSRSIAQCELTHLSRVQIDLEKARTQHQCYRQALAELGCEVVNLAEQPELPDAVFVEDVAIVLDEYAVITRPGAESRRPETDSLARGLREYRRLGFIEAPGTLDGGDVLRVGKTLYVGLSGRSNRAAIDQLRALIAPYGYTVKAVEVSGCLHLKSAVSQVADNTLLVNPSWVKPANFGTLEWLEVDPAEAYAANTLLIGKSIIYPTSFPRTRRRLEQRGIRVVPVDVSELQKAEGAVTCCSLVFKSDEGGR